ncbi:ABC transporter permease subunit [Singulisphaera sp. Ch08]|uniref:ABC transporter permease subunit n=1 Tax=Singulisphaera sp. Ch08 TaxID=3120278 RepID=A0AAU7CJ21_9BACT
MIMGPVFRAELMRTSRRRRYYVMRTLYGLGLLLLLGTSYQNLMLTIQSYDRFQHVRGYYRQPLISILANFAIQTFVSFAVMQLVMLLALVPALFGGVIADEKQRKTIHYLMASRLSSGEIVFDKLLARLLHVLVFVLLGVPVLSSLTLMGGIPWEYLVAAYVGTFSIIFFTAALATLVSTLARRVRQGVLISYLLVIFWLFIPAIIDAVCKVVYPRFYAWFGPINAWFQATSPVYLLTQQGFMQARMPRGGTAALLESFLWMVGLQTALGALFLLLAMQQLRPAFRRQETESRRLSWFGPKVRRPRWMSRPECGNDAMLWKECHFTRTDVFTKLVVLPATILLTVCVFLSSGVDESIWGAIKELYHEGYWGHLGARSELNLRIRQISPLYIGLWLLAVAGASASSLTVEREEDTWISLTSTPLRAWEILRGKMIGAVWGLRGFGGLIGLIWLAGLLTGALHPIGLMLGLVLVALLTWGVTALAIYASLTARNTSRALTVTIVSLVIIHGGFNVIAYPLLAALSSGMSMFGYAFDQDYLNLGCTPYLASFALVSLDDLRRLFADPNSSTRPLVIDQVAIGIGTIILLGHASAAFLLTALANRRFDAIVDRPRLK